MKIANSGIVKMACIISMLISTIPVIDLYSPWYLTAIPFVAILFFMLQTNKNITFLIKEIGLIVVFALLEFWLVQRKSSFLSYFVDFLISFIPCLIVVLLNDAIEDKKFYRCYFCLTSICMGITCLTTIIGLNKFPMASRELASGTAVYDTTRYTKINIGGYDFIYALVVFIPLLLWAISNAKGKRKIIYVAILLLDIACILKSQYTIALICLILSFLVVLFQKHKKIGAIIITIVIAIFLLLNGFTLLSALFKWMSDIVESAYVSDRLLQLSQLFAGIDINTNTTTERIDLMLNQFNVFKSSPILGYNWLDFKANTVTGHSFILDLLGGGGILGLLIVITIIYNIYNISLGKNSTSVSLYVKSSWFVLTLVSLVNPIIFPVISIVMFACSFCVIKIENYN